MKIIKEQLGKIIKEEAVNKQNFCFPQSIDSQMQYSIRAQLIHRTTLNEALLQEGIGKGMVKDAIQFVVSAGAEYGLGGVTLPAAGAGLAVGPAVETMVDSLFVADEIASAVETVQNVATKLGEFGELWTEARSAYSGDLKSYYKVLVKTIKKALDVLGKSGADAVEDIASKLKKIVEDLINSLVQSLKAGIKLVIPDATLGLAAAKVFEQGLQSLSENAFDLLIKAINKVDLLKDFVSDPTIAVDFFKDVFEQVIELMHSGAKKLEDVSWWKAVLAAGPVGSVALKKLGPTGLESAAEQIKDKMPFILKVISGVLTVIVPTAITAVGIFQILIREDWKSDESSEESEEKEKISDSYTRNTKLLKKKTGKLTENKLLRETIKNLMMENASIADTAIVTLMKQKDLIIVSDLSYYPSGAISLCRRDEYDAEYGDIQHSMGSITTSSTSVDDTLQVVSSGISSKNKGLGLGMILYNALLAICSQEDYWLMADRNQVSNSAQRIWNNWSENQSDYLVDQMDERTPEAEHAEEYDPNVDYFLTRDESDDVAQNSFHANDADWIRYDDTDPRAQLDGDMKKDWWFYFSDEYKQDFLKSSLTKRYQMNNPGGFIKALEAHDLLYRIG